MNIAAKVFCRVFQKAFRLALPILPYREPERFHKISEVLDLLEEKLISSVLLVTDKGIREAGLTGYLEQLLEEKHIHCAVYDRTCANPTVHNVEEAREMYEKEHCEALIAFGGGSPMDCAKAVGARIAYPKKNLNQLKGLLRVLRRIPPLIAIPTTAGTGSEVTLAAVITDPIVLEDYGKTVYKKLRQLAVSAGVAAKTDSEEMAAGKFIEAIRELNRRMSIPETFPEIWKEDIEIMAEHAAKEANPLYPVPKLMTAKELEKFYYMVAEGR